MGVGRSWDDTSSESGMSPESALTSIVALSDPTIKPDE
jgi:hypothetical protein